jgi:hypothetical protein
MVMKKYIILIAIAMAAFSAIGYEFTETFYVEPSVHSQSACCLAWE